MSEELKPCPFCGGNNLSVEGVTFYWVECNDCNASISGHETEEEAIKAWNRRAKDERFEISRQAAIEVVERQYRAHDNDLLELIAYKLAQLPTAEPERKTGKWVGVKEYCDHINEKAEREGKGHRFIPSGMNNCVYCNQCWESNDRRTTYCPNCGADMRGEEK